MSEEAAPLTDAQWDVVVSTWFEAFGEAYSNAMDAYRDVYELLAPLEPGALAAPETLDQPLSLLPEPMIAALVRLAQSRDRESRVDLDDVFPSPVPTEGQQ